MADEESVSVRFNSDDQPLACIFCPSTSGSSSIRLASATVSGKIIFRTVSTRLAVNEESENDVRLDLTNKSLRCLAAHPSNQDLFFAAGFDRTLFVLSWSQNKVQSSQTSFSSNSVTALHTSGDWLLCGDEEGQIILLSLVEDGRKVVLDHHADYISSFLDLPQFQPDNKNVLVTSADGTISIISLVTRKLISQSEQQDDELLSSCSISNGKVLVGTQTGIILVFSPKAGWKDCTDRIPGHPDSVAAMTTISESIVVTASSDGLVRVLSVLPTKFMGVIADHETFPVEYMVRSQDLKWLATVSHDERVCLTKVDDMFADSDEEEDDEDSAMNQAGLKDETDMDVEESESESGLDSDSEMKGTDEASDSNSDSNDKKNNAKVIKGKKNDIKHSAAAHEQSQKVKAAQGFFADL